METSSASPDRTSFTAWRWDGLHLRYVGIFCAGLLGCSNQHEVNEPSAAPVMTEPSPSLQTNEPPEPMVEPRDEPATSATTSSVDTKALDRFVAAVEPLGAGAMSRSHDATVEALRAFAGALATLSTVDRTATDEVRGTAERLASSHPSSLEHADMVKHALESGLSALSAQNVSAEHQARYEDATQTLRGAVEAIDVQEPLLKQQDDVARAFRAAANMVAIAGNARAPFPSGEVSAG